MSASLFAGAIIRGDGINMFNKYKTPRDFSYSDDIVEGVMCVIDKTANPNPEFDACKPDTANSYVLFRVYGIGNNEPVQLMEFVETSENADSRIYNKNIIGM